MLLCESQRGAEFGTRATEADCRAAEPRRRGVATRRSAAESRGRAAEASVAASWQARGYRVLARRLLTGAGELDLVVADPTTLIFIEVKARNSLDAAAYSVLPRQQSRLLQAASAALACNDDWMRPNIRFDVALVCNGAISQIEDAMRLA